jgi:hypothetical protein
MSESIKAGDEVLLNSDKDASIMTLDSIDDDYAVCVWRDREGKPQQAVYALTSLQKTAWTAGNDEHIFLYPFGKPNARVIVPQSAMVQGNDFIKHRIEGWFDSHPKPQSGETLRIPDYQFDPHLRQKEK